MGSKNSKKIGKNQEKSDEQRAVNFVLFSLGNQ
jgi:hypothetical protein